MVGRPHGEPRRRRAQPTVDVGRWRYSAARPCPPVLALVAPGKSGSRIGTTDTKQEDEEADDGREPRRCELEWRGMARQAAGRSKRREDRQAAGCLRRCRE